MGQKFRNLYQQIYDWDNLLAAYREARRGKSYSSSYLRFKEYYLANLRHLQLRLVEGAWTPDEQLTKVRNARRLPGWDTYAMVTDRMVLYLWGLLHHADHQHSI